MNDERSTTNPSKAIYQIPFWLQYPTNLNNAPTQLEDAHIEVTRFPSARSAHASSVPGNLISNYIHDIDPDFVWNLYTINHSICTEFQRNDVSSEPKVIHIFWSGIYGCAVVTWKPIVVQSSQLVAFYSQTEYSSKLIFTVHMTQNVGTEKSTKITLECYIKNDQKP